MATQPTCHDSSVAASAPPEETMPKAGEVPQSTFGAATVEEGPAEKKKASKRHVSFQIEESAKAEKTPTAAAAKRVDMGLFTPSTWKWFNSGNHNKRSSIGSTSSASSVISTPREIKQQVHHLDQLLASPLEVMANPLLSNLTLHVSSTHKKEVSKASRWSLDSTKTTAKEAESNDDGDDCTSQQSTDTSTESTSSHLSGLQGLQLELERAQDEPIPAPSPLELHPVQPLPRDLFAQLEIMDNTTTSEAISPLGQEGTEEKPAAATRAFRFTNQYDASAAAKASAGKKAKPARARVAALRKAPEKHTSSTTTSNKSSPVRTTGEKLKSASTASQKPNYLRATASSSRPSKVPVSPMRQSTRSKLTGSPMPRALNPKSKLQAPTRSSLLKSQQHMETQKAQQVDTKPKLTFSSPKKILGDRTNNNRKHRRMSMICPPTTTTQKRPTQVLCLSDNSHLLVATGNRKTVSKMHWTKRPPAPRDPCVKTHNRVDYQWCHHCRVWNTEHGTKQHNIFHATKKRSSVKSLQDDPDASFSTVA